MTRRRLSLICLAMLCVTVGLPSGGVNDLCAQPPQAVRTGLDNAQASGTTRKPPLGTIDSDTRWAFRALSPVSVSSPIVRLGDVVQPLNPNMAGWQRLRRSPIGLLPLGTQPMTIQRSRLERAILDAEATPLAIDWIGPEQIRVVYEEAKPTTPETPGPMHDATSELAQVSHQQPTASVAKPPVDASPIVSALDTVRIAHWVMLALDRSHPEISKSYRVELPSGQPELASLATIVGVTDISPLERIKAGDCRFRLVARSNNGPIEAEICLNLTAHPMVAVPRKVLSKGHRITIQDLEMQPIPQEEIDSDHVLDPAEVVGLEVHGFPRPGRPLNHSDLGSPTLVRRGDLIEVRVMGGGVTVTTNAKSHGDGAASDLIEVETLEPRKRLLARVVQPGLVEIVTRAPRVQP